MKIKIFYTALFLMYSVIMNAQSTSINAGIYDLTMTYFDFVPDTMVQAWSYPDEVEYIELDLNYDNIYDYKIIIRQMEGNGGGSGRVSILPYNNNEVIFSRIDSSIYQNGIRKVTHPFEYEELIDGSGNFDSIETYPYYFYWWDGMALDSISEWSDQGPKFVGIRMNVNDTIVYGWIKLELTTSNNYFANVIVMEYALSELFEPNSVFDNEILKFIKVYPNPLRDFLNIRIEEKVNSLRIEIIGMQGQVHVSKSFKDSGFININTKDLQPGIYLLRINADGSIYNSKILK